MSQCYITEQKAMSFLDVDGNGFGFRFGYTNKILGR